MSILSGVGGGAPMRSGPRSALAPTPGGGRGRLRGETVDGARPCGASSPPEPDVGGSRKLSDSGGGVAHITHLGGLVAGYLLLRGRNLSPASEVRYRYLRWKMDRARKKFGVYSGGRKDDWDKRIH